MNLIDVNFTSALIGKKFICPFQNYTNYSPEDLDTLLKYKHYINGWLTLFIIIIGILANSITICALAHRYMRKSSTNAYLLAMSMSNLFSLICLMLMTGLRFTLVHPYRLTYCLNQYENFINIFIPYLTPINQSFQLSGIYLIMAVSIDRYILVKRNGRATAASNRKRRNITWMVILLIYAFSFLFTLPNWFAFTSEAKWSELIEITNGTALNQSSEVYKVKHFKAEHTVLGKNKLFRQLQNIWLYIPFVFGIPIFILILVNILIIYELIKIGDRKRQLGTVGKIDRNITIMLVTIVLVFLVCQVPLTISHIVYVTSPEIMFERVFFIFNSLTNFLTCIYMSANFALFCFFGQAFRFTIQYMFYLRADLPNQPHRNNTFNFKAEHRNSVIKLLTSVSKRNKNPNDEANNLRSYTKKNPHRNNTGEEIPILVENNNNNSNKNNADELEIKPQRLYRFRSYSKTQNLYVNKSVQK